MKRYIRAAIRPWKVKYEVHWLSPDGKDCLLAGSNSLDEIIKLGKNQARELFTSPFETDERKFLFLKEMYIYDKGADAVVDTELDEYVDELMSELDSRIAAKQYKKSVQSATEIDHDEWEEEYDSDLEQHFWIREFESGSATISDFDDDGDWGYNVVIRFDDSIERLEKTFHQIDLDQVKAWTNNKIASWYNLYGVSYWLQDGTQAGATIRVRDDRRAYDEIKEALIEMHGDNFGGIADYFELGDDGE